MNNINHKVTVARENWIRASKELHFQIISPYIFDDGIRQDEIFAYLPQYGSPKGVLVGIFGEEKLMKDDPVYVLSRKKQCFFSLINLDYYQNYNSDYMKEVLDDWGKYVD